MSDREKLIELIDRVLQCLPWGEISTHTSEDIADHLISNGVTVQKWIPVSERLPSFEDAIQPTVDDDPSVLAVFKVDDRPRIYCIDVIRRHPEKFTYWMPLSEPPKECE